jgi:hypothetical protein
MKQVISYCMCWLIAWTSVVPAQSQATPLMVKDVQQLRQQYPQARIIQVSEAEYPQLAQQLADQGYRTTESSSGLQLAAVDESYAAEQTDMATEPAGKRDDCQSEPTTQSGSGSGSSEQDVRLAVDISDSVLRGSSSSGDHRAAVVFVIVGMVLVVVWALYIFKFLFDVANGYEPCDVWSEWVGVASRINESDGDEASFSGIRYVTGFREGITDVGIAVEIGRADIRLSAISAEPLEGTYWMLGPVLRWHASKDSPNTLVQMQFLAGSTPHDEVGVLGQARIGVQIGLSKQLALGFSWGVMNIDLNNDQGLLSEDDRYYYLAGASVSYQF